MVLYTKQWLSGLYFVSDVSAGFCLDFRVDTYRHTDRLSDGLVHLMIKPEIRSTHTLLETCFDWSDFVLVV